MGLRTALPWRRAKPSDWHEICVQTPSCDMGCLDESSVPIKPNGPAGSFAYQLRDQDPYA